MSESSIIKELNITVKHFKKLYETIQENNILIPEYHKLKKHLDEVESSIDDNNKFIRDGMVNIPAYYSEASLCALYEEMKEEE